MLNAFYSLPRFPILGVPLPLTISAYIFQDGKPDNVVAGGSVSLPRLRREVLFWDSPLQPKGARGVDSAPHPAFSLITSLHGSQTVSSECHRHFAQHLLSLLRPASRLLPFQGTQLVSSQLHLVRCFWDELW